MQTVVLSFDCMWPARVLLVWVKSACPFTGENTTSGRNGDRAKLDTGPCFSTRRIIECTWVEGTFKGHRVQPRAAEQSGRMKVEIKHSELLFVCLR